MEVCVNKRAESNHGTTSGAKLGQPVGHQFAMVPGVPALWPDFLSGQTARPTRVLLAEDDAHMRFVIAQDLLADPRVSLVAQAASVREGRRLAALHDFDVLLVDLNLGDGTGFDLMTHVKTLRPFAELVVISASDDEQHALHAFELGATGYLVKNSWFGNFARSRRTWRAVCCASWSHSPRPWLVAWPGSRTRCLSGSAPCSSWLHQATPAPRSACG
jgi:CheY-like chemotaxis protein